MKVLLHQCCGPCSLYPLDEMIAEGIEPVVFFYNPNIHGIKEFHKRMQTAMYVCEQYGVEYHVEKNYGLQEFIEYIDLNDRCTGCYEMRINKAAEKAKELGIEYITFSLLYSKMQKHEAIIELSKQAEAKYGVKLYYKDYRDGWQQGIDKSKEMGLYRQNYCGCIFSEADRFQTKLDKKFDKALSTKIFERE